MSVPSPITILIINPNSSESMTDGLKPMLTDLTTPNLTLEFYTAPQTAPPSIDDAETSALSASATLPALLPLLDHSLSNAPPHHHPDSHPRRYSAYLVACFSPHPLTPLLRDRTPAPVLNIFEAALLHARALAVPFGIVTTGHYWEAVLADGAREFFNVASSSPSSEQELGLTATYESNAARLVGVWSTGLTAAQLYLTEKGEVDRRIAEASAELVGRGAKAIILGCAGMSGMEDAIRMGAQRQGQHVRIIDGVRAGVVLLDGLARTQAM